MKFKYPWKRRSRASAPSATLSIITPKVLEAPPVKVESEDGSEAANEQERPWSVIGPRAPILDVRRASQTRAVDLRSSPQPPAIEKAPIRPELADIIPEDTRVPATSRLVYHTAPESAGADRFRYLRMRLNELWNTGRLKTLLITSPLPGDGKSTVALNLSTALAEGGRKNVLLLEADMHHASITALLGLDTRDGLAECLERDVNPLQVIRRIDTLSLYVLAAGRAQGNPSELLQGPAISSTLQKLSPIFDWILIDAPPVMPLTDALSLRSQASAALLVARAGCTSRAAIEESMQLLGKQHVVGIVLNQARDLDRIYSKYYSYGGSVPAVRTPA